MAVSKALLFCISFAIHNRTQVFSKVTFLSWKNGQEPLQRHGLLMCTLHNIVAPWANEPLLRSNTVQVIPGNRGNGFTYLWKFIATWDEVMTFCSFSIQCWSLKLLPISTLWHTSPKHFLPQHHSHHSPMCSQTFSSTWETTVKPLLYSSVYHLNLVTTLLPEEHGQDGGHSKKVGGEGRSQECRQ